MRGDCGGGGEREKSWKKYIFHSSERYCVIGGEKETDASYSDKPGACTVRVIRK